MHCRNASTETLCRSSRLRSSDSRRASPRTAISPRRPESPRRACTPSASRTSGRRQLPRSMLLTLLDFLEQPLAFERASAEKETKAPAVPASFDHFVRSRVFDPDPFLPLVGNLTAKIFGIDFEITRRQGD